MKLLVLLQALVSIILAPTLVHCVEPVMTDNTLRVHNSATPSHGQKVLKPRERWRIGGENGELLFGFIITAEIDKDGSVYLLDRWLGAVHVLGSDGEFLQQLSREGEGPGETNQPTDLTWMPGGELGITQPMPGRLVRVDKAGNPLGDIVPAVVSAQEAQFGTLTENNWRGGTFACCGSQINFRNGRMEVSKFLAVCDLPTGEELFRLLHKETSDDGRGTKKDADQYWITEGRWCLGPAGKIYTAPLRDSYSIHVYHPDGRLDRVIEREYKPRRRTSEEKTALKKRQTPLAKEWGAGREVEISETDPCIRDLRVASNGDLWVRHSLSNQNQELGTFATWDVFAANGSYTRAVSIEITGDPDNDKILFLDDDHILLVRGFYEASDAMWGPGESGEEEIVGEIVFYDVIH